MGGDGAFRNGVIRLNNNSNGVFYPGQVISGSVTFDLDRPIQITVLYIQILGEANVLWTETEMENGRARQVKYTGKDQYFDYTESFVGSPAAEASKVLKTYNKLFKEELGKELINEREENEIPDLTSQLPAGRQSFPFEYQIPFTAPSSFKGKRGEVSYSITVTLCYADDRPNETMKKALEVVAPFDLNLGDPSIRQPINLEFEEVYGCCISKPVMIRVRIPAGGYCPGQTIPIAVEVQNESNVEITKMIVQLLSKEMYRSQSPPSEYIMPEMLLVSTNRGPIMSNTKRNFTCDLVVPNILPPYLENCDIMDIEYFIRIKIKLSGCNDALEDESSICLGLVPIRETVEGEYVHPLKDRLPQGPIPVPPADAQLTVPPANVTGSNTSLHRAEYNGIQTTPYGTYPYPGQPSPVPSAKSNTSVTMGSRPEYQIGFKVPEVPSYPGSAAYPGPSVNAPPYPAASPYPMNNMAAPNNALPPYGQTTFAPSAPPP